MPVFPTHHLDSALFQRVAAPVRAALVAAALLSGLAVQAATTIRFDHSFVLDTSTTTVDGVRGAPQPLPNPLPGSGQLQLSFGSASETWLPGPGTGETMHQVRIALSFSSIDLLPAVLPLSAPPGFDPPATSMDGFVDFVRTEVNGLPVGSADWTLASMQLRQVDRAMRFEPSTFTIDGVTRGHLVGPVFGLFDTRFADLHPLTIAQGFVRNDKCFAPGVCIPNNVFIYSLFQRSDTFTIRTGQFSNVDETAYSGFLSLSNPVVAVPEPAAAALLLLGLAGVGAAVRRTRPTAA